MFGLPKFTAATPLNLVGVICVLASFAFFVMAFDGLSGRIFLEAAGVLVLGVALIGLGSVVTYLSQIATALKSPTSADQSQP